MKSRPDLSTSAATVVALLPGFAFPFVAAWSLGASGSDRLLLAASVSITLTGVIGSAVEANTISEIGRAIAAGRPPGRSDLRPYQRRVVGFAVVITLVLGAALVGLYSVGVPGRADFVILAAPVLAVPILGALASIRSGQLIARGRVSPAIGLQSARMLVPLLIVVIWHPAPLEAVVVGYVLGESIRLAGLSVFVRRLPPETPGADTDLPTRGLLWQAASSMTVQGGPVTDRVFLAGGPPGSISAYEMADKIFFAASQFVNLGFLVRRLAGWSGLAHRSSEEGWALLRRDLRALGVVCVSAVAILLAGCLIAVQLPFVPVEWRTGLVWAALLSVSLPFILTSICGGRLLIIARRQHLLIRFAATSVGVNAVLDWVFFELFGPIGIPLATVLVRGVAAVLYVVVVGRTLRSFIGSAIEIKNSATSSV